jgi:hypothetical protein
MFPILFWLLCYVTVNALIFPFFNLLKNLCKNRVITQAWHHCDRLNMAAEKCYPAVHQTKTIVLLQSSNLGCHNLVVLSDFSYRFLSWSLGRILWTAYVFLEIVELWSVFSLLATGETFRAAGAIKTLLQELVCCRSRFYQL